MYHWRVEKYYRQAGEECEHGFQTMSSRVDSMNGSVCGFRCLGENEFDQGVVSRGGVSPSPGHWDGRRNRILVFEDSWDLSLYRLCRKTVVIWKMLTLSAQRLTARSAAFTYVTAPRRPHRRWYHISTDTWNCRNRRSVLGERQEKGLLPAQTWRKL